MSDIPSKSKAETRPTRTSIVSIIFGMLLQFLFIVGRVDLVGLAVAGLSFGYLVLRTKKLTSRDGRLSYLAVLAGMILVETLALATKLLGLL